MWSTFWTCFVYLEVVRGGLEGGGVEFSATAIPQDPTFLPKYRMEHVERNTSQEYDLWKQMDINLIEWPGNITTLEAENPLLHWGKQAKLISSPCNVPLGMDFKAYAYKYLHLTWGPFRMTSSYCPPLKLPRSTFQGQLPAATLKSTSIAATNFEFVADALLIIVEAQFVVRVGELEASHRREGSLPIPTPEVLSYTLATGLTSRVTTLVTQNCCKNRLTKTCTHGELVLVLNERSSDGWVYISTDAGRRFKKIKLRPFSSARIYSALISPRLGSIAALHGSDHQVKVSHYSMVSGQLVPEVKGQGWTIDVTGRVQMKQIGEEESLLIWDGCKAWYSPNAGSNVSEALFYIHSDLRRSLGGSASEKRSEVKHLISRGHCHLGEDSSFAQDWQTGKVSILDSRNNFFYGIDTKSARFPLIGSNVDMTLILPKKLRSIAPFFDFNNRPKLMYPPRFLKSEDVAYKDKNYKNRLGMRLFPRSIFPSDFMAPFYEENIPKRFRSDYGLGKCQTSSIIIDSALSQKPKIFYTAPSTPFNFTVEFKSFRSDSEQLKWTPEDVSKNLKITSSLEDFMRLGVKEYYYFKYLVTVLPKTVAVEDSLYRMSFFTTKSVRCVHQPQVTVWIQIGKFDKPNKNGGKTSMADPEPVKELRNFLNGSSVRKILHDKNPMKISQCSQKV